VSRRGVESCSVVDGMAVAVKGRLHASRPVNSPWGRGRTRSLDSLSQRDLPFWGQERTSVYEIAGNDGIQNARWLSVSLVSKRSVLPCLDKCDEIPSRDYAEGVRYRSPGSAAQPRHPGGLWM